MSKGAKKLGTRLAACAMSVVLALGMLPVAAFAEVGSQAERPLNLVAGTAGVEPALPLLSAQSDYDISTGFITINSSNVGTWNGRTITGSVNKVGNSFPQGASDGATSYRSAICIDGVSVNLTIRDLSIVAIFDNNVGAYKVSPILLLNGATLNLTLEGSNTLTACVGGAGICVPDGCALNIGGSGSLVATGGDGGASEQLYRCFGGAAIGTEDKPLSSALNRTGSITINGGTINATGGAAFSNRGGSAGIGGSGYVDGVVTINDGNVTAEGGDYAAGIGGGIGAGGIITINGGTVKAIANTAGSAIGSGAGTNSSTIAIKGGNVTADGNIGSPGTASGKSTLTVDFSKAVITCEGNGCVNCRNAAIQTFTVTVYDAALTQGDHACTFWVNEKNTNSAAMPATLSVSEAGVGTATVKGLVSYGDAYSMQVTGHLQIGDRTYDTAAVQMSAATTSISLYSGYRVTLTGTVYDVAIASGQTGTVSVEGVTLASQSVSTSARKATVSAVFNFAEGAVDDGALTKNVTVTVGGKTYAVDNVTFAKSATHQKKGSFTVSEGGIDYVKLDGEVAFVSPHNVIETNTTTWTGDKNNGFYAAPAGQSVAINDQVKVSGNVNLVLTDGSTLTAAKGIDMGEGSSLTIWQQSEGTGKLVAVAQTDKVPAPGIGSTSDSNIKIFINGGTVEATGYACPGIGGDSYSDNLNITINAGKVTAKGSSSGGEGIGSKSGTITINGGTVEATASGTGSVGIWSESGSITINGGHVTATGTGDGAAIGSKAVEGTGSIAISGGTVVANAVSDACAAAIGGGNAGSFTSIAISGGDVTANGGKYAAAIGGGIRSTAGSATIEITGGTVRANGGDYGAGIGNGFDGNCAITTTLSYDNASSGMSVYASSYRFKNDDATNTVKLSKAFKDAESGTGYPETNSADLAAIAGKTLVPSESYGVTVEGSIANGTVTASPSRTAKGASVTLTVEPAEGYHLVTGSLKATYAAGGKTKELALTPDANDPTKYTFTMPAADVTVTVAFTNHEHEFTYAVDGATITATCDSSVGTCDLPEHKATLTVAAPTGELTYTGVAQPLASGGSANTALEFALGGADAAPADGWAGSAPAGRDAGSYTVWYRAKADDSHLVGDAAKLEAVIAKAPLTVTAKPKAITYGEAPANDGVAYAGFVNGEDESTPGVLGGTLAFEYSYSRYGDAGSYAITPKGLTAANYKIAFVAGTLTVHQKGVGLKWGATSLSYNGKSQAPAAAATGLVNGDAVSVAVSGAQVNAGTGYTATAKKLVGVKAGNYKLPDSTASRTATFSIARAKVAMPTTKTGLTFSGKTQVGVASGAGYKLAGTASATAAGAYRTTATPDANHCWPNGSTAAKTISWKISPASVAKAKVTLKKTSCTYNGKALKPGVKSVVLGGKTLKAGADYSVAYKSNKNLGTASAVVTGKGNYTGTTKSTFKIVLGKAATPSAKRAGRSAVGLSWKKVAGAKGYQLRYRQAGGTWKTATAKGASKTVKGLKAGKTYQFRVRAVSGKQAGAWSAIRKYAHRG